MKKLEKSKIDELATYLVEGSVWQNKRGKRYTVLTVTNVTVKEKLLDKFIPSVVFLNENNEVFSLHYEIFLRAYSFVEINEQMSKCVENCYKCNIGELDQQAESILNELEAEVAEDEVVDLSEEDTQEQQVTEQPKVVPNYLIEFVALEPENPVLNSEELTEAFVGYSPSIECDGTIIHKLLFKPTERVDSMHLSATFDPSLYGQEVNTYERINLSTAGAQYTIEWDLYGNVVPELHCNQVYLALLLCCTKQQDDEVNTVEQATDSDPIVLDVESTDKSTVQLANVEPVPQQATESPVQPEVKTGTTPDAVSADEAMHGLTEVLPSLNETVAELNDDTNALSIVADALADAITKEA